MQLQGSDLTVYVFVLATMLSGAWMAEEFGTAWSPTLLALVAVVAALWTVYHRFRVAPRLVESDGDTEERRGEEGRSPSDATGNGDDRSGTETGTGSGSGARE